MYRLSLTEAQTLAEGLGTHIQLFPFQLPSSPSLVEDQVRTVISVAKHLEKRGFFHRGRLLPDLEQGFRLLSHYQHAIAVMGTVDRDREIYARVSSDGRRGVLVIKRGDVLDFQLIRPEAMTRTAVSLLPKLQPGPGSSVTVQQRMTASTGSHQSEEQPESFMVPGVRGGTDSQRGFAEEVLRRPRTGAGYFVPEYVGKDHRSVTLSCLGWLDTEDGRYMITGGTGDDGRGWATYAPADHARMDRQLRQSLFASE